MHTHIYTCIYIYIYIYICHREHICIFKLALYSFEAQVQLSDKNCPAISTCHHDATQKNNEGDEGHDGTESHEDDDESPEIHKDDEGSNSEWQVKESEG